MKHDYYVTHDCLADDEHYICKDGSIERDYNKPIMWKVGLVVCADTAKMVRAHYGKDAVKLLPDNKHVKFIPDYPGAKFGNMYYIPVMN